MAFTLGNAVVYTGEKIFENGYVTFRNGRIESIGSMEGFHGRLDRDLKGMLVMPSWINGHTHVYSTLARGMSVEFNPGSFTQLLEQLWWRLDRSIGRSELEASAYVAAAEFIHSGVSTVFDHHSSPRFVRGSLDLLKDVIVDNAGMRGVFCHETSDRDGVQNDSIEENADFYEKNASGTNARGMMGIHASFTVGDRTLSSVSRACDGKIPIHVHVAEGPEDENDSIGNHGMRIIERFEKHSLLIPGSIYAHCVHIDDGESDLIGRTGGFLATMAQSNMNNGVGLADLRRFMSKGTRVVLGNDGFGFSPSFDLRSTVLGQKHLNEDPTAFSTANLREIIDNTCSLAQEHLEERFGRIREGYAADLAVVDYTAPTPMTFDNFYDHLFFGITESRVDSLYISGNPVMENGVIKTFDEKEVKKEARKVAQRLWKNL